MVETKLIRNFGIIAHIDHGKSTLADRLLEFTGAVSDREMMDQFLDSMDLEREKGITIKAQAVQLHYRSKKSTANQDPPQELILNLIDTPGHVDFSYEVSRSLAACEGALLLVDAAQGVEAQTIANAILAMELNLVMIPIINKIDLDAADVERVKAQLCDYIGVEEEEILLISAKKDIGTEEVLEAVASRIPYPSGINEAPLQALVFDSDFDNYRGVIAYLRIFNGQVERGQKIQLMSSGEQLEVTEVGIFSPSMKPVSKLYAGEVGYLLAGIRDLSRFRIGDTVTDFYKPASKPLPGYREVKPVVFAGLYPIDPNHYHALQDALQKLRLNDPAFSFQAETSEAMGFGFRCGFLGLLHMEIVQERLEREFDLNLLATAPSVIYKVVTKEGQVKWLHNPAQLPAWNDIEHMEEPYIIATIVSPSEFLGNLLKLLRLRRGVQKRLEYLDAQKVILEYDLPFNEVILDFYDRLKSISRGYASFDYEPLDFKKSELVKLDILINGELVDALSIIVHKSKAEERARTLVEKMKEVIPRQLFQVAIQAAIGSKVIARETVKALRKNVTAKCYGGDITRKRKLLEKQKEGKKRMKQVGKVQIPQEAFMAVLKLDD